MATSLASPSRMNPHYPTTRQGASSGAELVTLDGRSLPLVASTLRAEARGGLARLVLEQRFVNRYDETLAVTYRMPLPADGAVCGYAFEIAGRVVKGVVDRKQRARERFDAAIASGRTAALLEQERSDIFTQQIGNIPAGETIDARITVDQRLAWLPEGEWELRFPTVIGPRYIGSADTIADARATHVKVATEDLGVRLQIALAIGDTISDGRKASSPSHQLAARPDGTIALSTETPARPRPRGALAGRDARRRAVARGRAPGRDRGGVRPAHDRPAGAGVAGARRCRAICSSCSTPAARWAAVRSTRPSRWSSMLIDSLGEQDRLELIEFSNSPRRYKQEPVIATAKAKAEAIKWVRSRTADGGTEMRDGGGRGAAHAARSARSARSCSSPTATSAASSRSCACSTSGCRPSCRLHVLGVGSAVNRSLATALARAGRGAEVIVGVDEDAERGAKRLLDRTRMPVLTNVEIAGTALVRHAPEHVPDVFEGAPLIAALELRPEGGELVVRGQLAHERVGAADPRPRDPPSARATPRSRRCSGASAWRTSRRGRRSTRSARRSTAQIEALGLRFQIATRLTSWVAIDERVSVEPGERGRGRELVVPQELPYGTSAAAFGLRRSAPAMAPMMATLAGGYSLGDDEGEMFGGDGPEETVGAAYDEVPPASPPAPPAPSAPRGGLIGGIARRRPASEVEDRERAEDKPAPAAPKLERPSAFQTQPRTGAPIGRPAGGAPPAPEQPRTVVLGKVTPIMEPAPLAPEPLAPMQMAPSPRPRARRARWMILAALIAAVLAVLLWWMLG